MSGETDFAIENGVLTKYTGIGGDVVIPEGVTKIGDSVFNGCAGLTSVTIPASVVRIGRWAFNSCTGVEEYRVAADNPKYAGDGPLLLGTASKTLIAAGKVEGHITLSDRVNKIGEYAFEGCTGLTGVTIPEGYKSIGNYAFCSCKNLRDVSLPTTISRVGEGAFNGCESMPFLVWINPDTKKLDDPGVPVLLDAASPSQLPKECQEPSVLLFVQQYTSGAEMPESRRKNYLDYIRRTRKRWLEMAMDRPALLKLLLAEKMIDAKLFPDALAAAQEHNKTEITAMLLEYQNDASFQVEKKKVEKREEARTQRFFETGKLTVSELKKIWSYKKLEDGSLMITGYKGNETDAIIPDVIGKDEVKKIGGRAFADCTALTSVTIPAGVTEIEWNAFSGCTGLTSIVIPAGVTEIGSNAFLGCTGLTSVTIPAGVTKIDWMAFKGCTGLTSVTIPEGVTKIGDNAFADCTGLTSITIPDSVTEIGKSAFKGCAGLTSVTIPGGVTEIGKLAFADCVGLADEQGLIIAKGIVFGCTGLAADVIIPGGVTKIDVCAFFGCTGLTSVTIPDSVTQIGAEAFKSCKGLASITIPAGVSEIGESTFAGCTGLTAVTIPDSVTKIGKDSFSYCTGLTSVTIPDSVAEIEWRAFAGCVGLADEQGFIIVKGIVFGHTKQASDIIIPEGTTTIDPNAFSGRADLTSITIPASVTKIAESAFWSCPALNTITIRGKDAQLVWGSNIRVHLPVTYTIHAPVGSTAEEYAREYDIPFVAI